MTNNVASTKAGNTGLYAKGETTSDLPVGQLIEILRDESVSKEWST